MSPTIHSFLKATPLFAALTDSEIEFLAARSGLRPFDGGEILFSEGDQCTGLYIVTNGRVRIFKTSANGREQVLAFEGPGNSIAEIPVFDGGRYPASASAAVPSTLLFISRQDFRSVCLEHPEVALKVLQVVGGRLRRLVSIIEELSFTTVRQRLIAWIIRQAKARGRQTDRGTTFGLETSQQELASQIGTVRELVSRNLARLQSQGFIDLSNQEITILDPEGLEADLTAI